MRVKPVTVALLLSATFVGACASIAGLDSYTKGKCAGGDCDGGSGDATVDDGGGDSSDDGAVDSAPTRDAADSAPPRDSGMPDTVTGGDACTQGNVANCSACAAACDTAHSQGASCSGNTTCLYSACNQGFADCKKGAPNLDGCETPTTTPTNCGACGRTCGDAGVLAADCDSGTSCAYQCKPGFLDCNVGSPPNTDGCETQGTTVTNCGACGRTCGTTGAVGAACDSGVNCTYTCSPGFSDCNYKTAPNTDGCECNTPGCCTGGVCQTTRVNGAPGYTDEKGVPFAPALGQNYYACDAPPTYNAGDAYQACAAWVAQFGGDPTTACSGWICPSYHPPENTICYTTYGGADGGTATCTGPCWNYASAKQPLGAGVVSSCSNCTWDAGLYY